MFKINLHANTTLKKKKSIAQLAGATKVIVSHLSNLNQSKSTFLDGTDDVMFPYALGWLGNLTGCITLDAFYNLCLHNCNLFKLATRCRGKPNRKRQSSNKKSKSISHADREDASVNNARPNKRQMVIGNWTSLFFNFCVEYIVYCEEECFMSCKLNLKGYIFILHCRGLDYCNLFYRYYYLNTN